LAPTTNYPNAYPWKSGDWRRVRCSSRILKVGAQEIRLCAPNKPAPLQIVTNLSTTDKAMQIRIKTPWYRSAKGVGRNVRVTPAKSLVAEG
jgi:hypothetical protein